jgi:hypothetical protein
VPPFAVDQVPAGLLAMDVAGPPARLNNGCRRILGQSLHPYPTIEEHAIQFAQAYSHG